MQFARAPRDLKVIVLLAAMDSVPDIFQTIPRMKTKTRRRALMVFGYLLSILACYTVVEATRLALMLLKTGMWEYPGGPKIVILIFSMAAASIVPAWSWWRFARTAKRTAADTTKTKAE